MLKNSFVVNRFQQSVLNHYQGWNTLIKRLNRVDVELHILGVFNTADFAPYTTVHADAYYILGGFGFLITWSDNNLNYGW